MPPLRIGEDRPAEAFSTQGTDAQAAGGHVHDNETFNALIRRLTQGDDMAAQELVGQDEAVVRLEVRCWLGTTLRRQLDSIDICQAVWASFFARERPKGSSDEPFSLDNPAQLIALLKDMARKKVCYEARKLKTQKRDGQHVALEEDRVIDFRTSVSQLVIERELNQAFLRSLDPLERRIFELLGIERSWQDLLAMIDQIADEVGVAVPFKKNVVAMRKWYNRAMKRVAGGLGLI
ncbi:MAG: RNA polymerase sigma factor [Dehalococcoidia bacterium]